MKFRSLRVIKWYSATLGASVGAVLFAYLGFVPVLPGIVVFSLICYGSLASLRPTEEESNPYHKLSESIAIVGIISFLPLIMLTDFLAALVVFIGFAQLALNFQTYDYRRFYVGMAVSFVFICVGAAESKSGFYLVFFLIYTILAGMSIGYAYMAQRQNMESPQWDWTSRTRVSLLMVGLALVIYLALPRFQAGGWFSQPSSDHFYHNKKWESEAKKNENNHVVDLLSELTEKERDEQNRLNPDGLTEKGNDNSDHDGKNKSGELKESDGNPHEQKSLNPEGLTEKGDENSDHDRKNKSDDYEYRGFKRKFDINTPDAKGHRFSNHIVARMRSDHSQYLRVRIFDIFDGMSWHASSDQSVFVGMGFDGVELMPPGAYASSELNSYEIYIESNIGNYIPVAAVPVKLKFPATAVTMNIFGQLCSPGALREGTSYAVVSQHNVLNGRLFAELDHQPLPSYLQLPPLMDQRIGELAGKITEGATSQLAKAVALESHLRSQYKYDFNSAFISQKHTPLSEFLFERKRGHCEYFASALSIMLRTQNISSRLVTGFSAGNRNPMTGYYDIYAIDGHAWVEAFVDNQGWVILEPTAYYDGPLLKEEKLSAQQINDYVYRETRLRKALGQDKPTLEGIINALWQLIYVMVSAGLGYVKLFILTCWQGIVFMLIVISGVWYGWLKYKGTWSAYRLNKKVAAHCTGQPEKDVEFYLAAIEELLKITGFKNTPGFTIERYLTHIQSIGGVQEEDTLSASFNRIYYNNEPGDQEAARNYKLIFQNVYALGFHHLQTIAKNKCS